jgi:hypothetical protein
MPFFNFKSFLTPVLQISISHGALVILDIVLVFCTLTPFQTKINGFYCPSYISNVSLPQYLPIKKNVDAAFLLTFCRVVGICLNAYFQFISVFIFAVRV